MLNSDMRVFVRYRPDVSRFPYVSALAPTYSTVNHATVRAYLERALFSGFRGSRFCVATLEASLPQRIPEKRRRVPVVVVGSGVPRRLAVRHRPVGLIAKPKRRRGRVWWLVTTSRAAFESVALRVGLPTRFAEREPVRCAWRGGWRWREKQRAYSP
jgi:hypothetical protein